MRAVSGRRIHRTYQAARPWPWHLLTRSLAAGALIVTWLAFYALLLRP